MLMCFWQLILGFARDGVLGIGGVFLVIPMLWKYVY